MANMNTIHKALGNNVCRRCIVKYYKVNLQPEDCRYAMYPDLCSHCGVIHNIVIDLNLSGKRKLMFK